MVRALMFSVFSIFCITSFQFGDCTRLHHQETTTKVPPQPITTPFENVPKLHGGCQEEIQYYSWNGKKYKNKRQTHKKCGNHRAIKKDLAILNETIIYYTNQLAARCPLSAL